MGLRHADLYGAIFSASPGGGYRPPECCQAHCLERTSWPLLKNSVGPD